MQTLGNRLKNTIAVTGFLVFGGLLTGVVAVQPASALECGILEQSMCNAATNEDVSDIENTGLWSFLLMVVRILTAGVAIVAVGGIIYGAVIYTTASGSPEKVKKAYRIFMNVGIGILMYAAMYSLMQWAIPGGAF